VNINTQSLTKAAGIGIVVGIVLGLIGLIPFIGIVTVCLGIFVPIGVGALYAYFSAQEGEALDYGPAATGGAVSAAVSGLVSGIFSLLVGLVVGTTAGAFSQFGDLGLSGGEAAAATGIAAVGGVIGLCVGLVVSGVLGAIGGAVYVAIQGQRG